MAKKIIVTKGEIYNGWEVIEPNVINPNTTEKGYVNKPLFSKCRCTKCNETITYIKNNHLKNCGSACKSCLMKARPKTVQIGQQYGYLLVTGDAGYQKDSSGKNRHFSYCTCTNCGKTNVKVMDNRLQSGNNVSCGCLHSKGENIIKNILEENNVIFNQDIVFPQLLAETGRKLRFDFILYNQNGSVNRFIEFDGNQHQTGMWGGNWSHLETKEKIQERDLIKNNFCKQHGYTLIRLPYSVLNNLTLDLILGDKYVI